MSEPRVLYVVGHPRSGSTIVGNVLGVLPGVFHAGELHYLWTPGLPEPRQRCGCGTTVRECPLWRRAFGVAFDAADDGPPAAAAATAATAWGLPGTDAERLYALQRRASATLPTLGALATGRRPTNGATAEYLDAMGRVYRGLAAASSASVIVDSSKWPRDAALIGRMPDLDVTFVHLVREPWGGVYSRLPRDRSDQPGGARPPGRLRLLLESARWLRSNLAAEVVAARSGRRWLTLRYEDFVADPGVATARLGCLVGLDAALPFDGREIMLGTNHTAGGNRNRWQSGPVAIRADRKWRDGLRAGEMRLISAATWPYRRRHGYHHP